MAASRRTQSSTMGACAVSRAASVAFATAAWCVGEEVHDGRRDARQGILVELFGIVRAGERLALVLRGRQRPRHTRRDSHALPGRAAITLALPARVALHLVVRIEAFALEQAFGEQQRHGRIVGPRAARQIEGSAAEQVPDGREAPRFAELRVRGQRIAHGQPDQRSLEPLAQRSRGIQDIGRPAWDRPSRDQSRM